MKQQLSLLDHLDTFLASIGVLTTTFQSKIAAGSAKNIVQIMKLFLVFVQ